MASVKLPAAFNCSLPYAEETLNFKIYLNDDIQDPSSKAYFGTRHSYLFL